MSLYTSQHYPYIATHNIECYKLIGYNSDTKQFVSPLQRSIIENYPNINVTDEIFYSQPIYDITHEQYIITKQGTHTFANINDAKKVYKLINRKTTVKGDEYYIGIYRCVIKQGTPFYEGKYTRCIVDKNTMEYKDFTSYASKQLEILYRMRL